VGYTTVGISALSLQYVGVPVTAATINGAPYNPVGGTVQMAFMPQATQVPGNSDWQSATWGTDTADLIYPYTAYCLIGPGGTITLGLGTYVIYVRVTGSPEIPVLVAGLLQVT
jgi:hypothetical protein